MTMHPDEQAIRNLVAEWERATLAEDLAAIGRLMADDAVFLTAGNPPIRGRDAFLALSRSMIGKMRIEGSGTFEEIRVLGDWAYAWRSLRVAMTPVGGGETKRRAGPTLTVFRREPDGRWVLARDANLLVAEM
jgi:uncharacterized protein (TIGR02246 family)